MIDFHSHILPRMDDGASSIDEALEMLRMSLISGTHAIVATPHFYPTNDNPEAFLKRRSVSENLLLSQICDNENFPNIYIGAEVGYFTGISHFERLDELCIDGTKSILIEMPFCNWSSRAVEEVASIYSERGIIPIIAHIERYFQSSDIIDYMTENHVLIQANSESFGRFRTKRKLLKMLSQGGVHLLGSDCHNMGNRKPNLDLCRDVIMSKLGFRQLDEVNKRGEFLLRYARFLH